MIVPPFVSQWRFYKRIGRAQELVGLEDRISHVTGFLLFLVALFLLPFEIVYASTTSTVSGSERRSAKSGAASASRRTSSPSRTGPGRRDNRAVSGVASGGRLAMRAQCRVPVPHLVHVRAQALRQAGVANFEHVFGVLLA